MARGMRVEQTANVVTFDDDELSLVVLALRRLEREQREAGVVVPTELLGWASDAAAGLRARKAEEVGSDEVPTVDAGCSDHSGWVSRKTAASRLDVSPERVSALVGAGRLVGHKVHARCLLIDPDSIQREERRRAEHHP